MFETYFYDAGIALKVEMIVRVHAHRAVPDEIVKGGGIVHKKINEKKLS